MIEDGLVDLLTGSAAVSAICQNNITPEPLPQNSPLPAITYSFTGAHPDPTFKTSGFQRHRIEFKCRAETGTQASRLRETLRQTLEGYSGVLSDGTFLQDVQFCELADGYQEDARTFVRPIEFYLFFCFSN
jgi:hypothetical protein